MLHKNITTGDVHYIQNWSVADTTARDALSVAAADVGKVCQVTGTNAYYILTDDSPMTWQLIGSSVGAGTGDVVGPASATDNAVVRFNLTTGKLVQDSAVTIADTTGDMAGVGNLTMSGDLTLTGAAKGIIFEGTTADANETTLVAGEPTADRTVTLPDATTTLAGLSVAQSFTANQTFAETTDTVFTITDGAAFEIDPGNGNIQVVTLGANRTPAATNFAAGQCMILGIDDGTAYTITWTTVAPTWVKPGGTASAPTLATTGYTWILLWKVSTTIYAAEVGKP